MNSWLFWKSLNLEFTGFCLGWRILGRGSHSVSQAFSNFRIPRSWTIRMNHQDQPLSSLCVLVCACLGQRTTLVVILQIPSSLFWDSVSLASNLSIRLDSQWVPRIHPLFRKILTPMWCHEIFPLSLMGLETVLALCGPALAWLELCICISLQFSCKF